MTSVQEIEKSQMKQKAAQVKVGDTVRVYQRIEEAGKERVQAFEGTVIAFKEKNNPRATIRVRRIASGVGVEKTFLLHSPWLEKIEIVRGGKARRARLYYMRQLVGKAAQKLQEEERESQVWEKEKFDEAAQVEAVPEKANEEKTEKPVTEKEKEEKREEATEKIKAEEKSEEQKAA